MTTKRGGFDLDEVIAKTHTTMFNHFQAQGLLKGKTMEDWTKHHMEDSFPEITYETISHLLKQHSFWRAIEPNPIIVQAVKNMKDKGVEIHIVTARDARTTGANVGGLTREWLHLNGVPYNKLALVSARDKPDYCFKNKLDFMVEDKLSTAITVAATWFTDSYLLATQYNELPQETLDQLRITRRESDFFLNLYEHQYHR